MARFLGIARERVYSPCKMEDDRAILAAVAERLGARHEVSVTSADERLPEPDLRTVVFTMAQGPQALAVMRRWQERGVRVINSPQAIENCHRRRMIEAFERHGVTHPPSVLVDTAVPEFPEWIGAGAWLKRGDVHATQAGDVVRIESAAAARAVCADFDRRAIATALVQAHVEGVVVKFYAVPGRFFECFPEGGTDPRSLDPVTSDAMRALAEEGAAALALDVFGGDCVCAPDGGLWLIDMNDWPSYGRCRLRAADAIAAHLEERLSEDETA
jgi:hypothetical protein